MTKTPSTTPDMNRYGLIDCSACKGTGVVEHNINFANPPVMMRNYPCAACHRTGKVLSWWPNAFVSDLVITGPLLASDDDTLDQDRDPQLRRWENGHVAWSAITHLSQFTIIHHLQCRMPDSVAADGQPLTYQFRQSPSGMAIETTKLHLPNDYVIIGLPYNLVGSAWLRYLQQKEK